MHLYLALHVRLTRSESGNVKLAMSDCALQNNYAHLNITTEVLSAISVSWIPKSFRGSTTASRSSTIAKQYQGVKGIAEELKVATNVFNS